MVGPAPRVVVLGSCTVDLVFEMPRMPLAGETLFATHAGLYPGGKGLNQAIAAQRLGAEAAVIGCVGTDALAHVLLDALAADQVDASSIVRHPTIETGVAVPVVMPDGGNRILAAPRANLALEVAAVEAAAPVIAAAGIVLAQLETPIVTVVRAAELARAAGVPFLLNPAPAQPIPDALWGLVDILVVNEVEAAAYAPAEAEPLAQAAALARRGPGLVVVTLGPQGMVYVLGDEAGALAATAVTAVDSVGAGDCFCGALGAGLAEGMATREALTFAVAAAGLSVTRRGAAPSYPTRAEVAAAVQARGR